MVHAISSPLKLVQLQWRVSLKDGQLNKVARLSFTEAECVTCVAFKTHCVTKWSGKKRKKREREREVCVN